MIVSLLSGDAKRKTRNNAFCNALFSTSVPFAEWKHENKNGNKKNEFSFSFRSAKKKHCLLFLDLLSSRSLCRPLCASMLATRAALAAGANSTVPLASTIASLSANATTLAASYDATVTAILNVNASPISKNLTTLLDTAVETHGAEAAVDATATARPLTPRLSYSSSSSSSSENIAYISAVAVAAAGVLIVADAAISLLLGLGLHWQLVGGGARCIGQLTVLGALLGPIFRSKAPPLVAAYAAFMLVVGSSEAASRPAYSYRGMTKHVVCSLGAASTAFLGYSLAVAVRPRPWWDPQYSIPTLGLMLGNAISGVAVGLGALLEDFAANGDRIELLLCLGASRWEATRGAVSRAVRLALTPLLNQLNVVGLVVSCFLSSNET